MKNLLTPAQRVYLVKKHKRERDKRVCDRIKAVLLFDSGYTYTQIAAILLLDDETIRRHVKDYVSKTKLSPEHLGSQSKLDDDQSSQLVQHLSKNTYLYVKEICAYVENHFKVIYSVSGMTKWLKAKGFCYKKPHAVPAKADADKQAVFKEAYQQLKSNLTAEEVLYFVDSSHPQHQTKLAFGWIKKGERSSKKMTACQKRVNLIGAMDLSRHHVEYQQVDWVNAESIKHFLTQLQNQHPEKKTIHLIWDNAGYHKSKEVIDFVKDTKIKLHYLPPYSPNLNPIERLWKIMHEQVTYNRYYEKFSDFTKAILNFFENIDHYRSILKTRITDNFQKLEPA